ncbi:MAG: VCBS repeat-containing protein [Saprospiraceae bacterium]|nr:VCBS repeat-containing protein [Saprospiraceae bacterium]
MDKFLIPFFCLSLIWSASAQFGNTPVVLTQSPNSNQIGIWTADINGDGDTDLLVAHHTSLIWYKNLGSGIYSNDQELIIADMPNSFGFLGGQFQDIDADAEPDLIFDRYWRKGLGNGEFAAQTSILSNSLSALCDVDSDGMPDALIRDNDKIYWQRNLGSGSFSPAQVLGLANASDIYNFHVDFNSDGKQDFIARYSDACFWYKNLGNNQFEVIQFLDSIPLSITVGNINNNGKPDLIAGVGGQIAWYEFETSGQHKLKQVLNPYRSGETSLGDLDADGDIDLFVGSVGTTSSHRARYFAFDAVSGQFDPVAKNHNFYILDHPYSEILDLNEDGNPDVLIGSGTGQFGWLKNLAPGSFSSVNNLNKKLDLPQEIEIADLENDGDMDIFTVGFVLENLGNAQYAEKRPASPGTGSRSFYGDLDGDGIKDLSLPLGDHISWQKGLGNGQFGGAQILAGLVTSCKQVGGGDLDRDGDIDLFAANGTETVEVNARFYWFENDGSGNFTEHLLATGIQFCSGLFTLDVNDDGLLDMALLFFNGDSPRLYRNLGGGNFAPPSGLFPGGTPSPTRVNQDLLTDLDGDGKLDYVYCTRDYTQTQVAWYQNLGSSGFGPERILVNLNHPGYSVPRFCVFDANLDGRTDVVVCDNHNNRFLLIQGLGNSNFSSASTMYDEPNYGNFFGVAAHDVDGDGKLDIVYGEDTDYLGNFNGYNRLSWLKNLYPEAIPGLQLVLNNSTCDDNNTPLDATDDRQVLQFKVSTVGNTIFSNRFILFDELTQTALDTFPYDLLSTYSLAPGSAGISISSSYSFRDLLNPDLKKEFYKPAIESCSPEAPTAIGVNYFKASCDDSYTPADPSDDRIKFELNAAIYKDSNNSFTFSLSSNLGTPAQHPDEWNTGFYMYPETFFYRMEVQLLRVRQLLPFRIK